jgi:hypothetical protein
MKKVFEALLPVIGTILMCLGGCTSVPKHADVDLSPVSSSIANIDHSIDQAIRSKTIQAAKPALTAAKKEVAVAGQKLSVAQNQALQVQGQRDWWQSNSLTKDTTITKQGDRIHSLEHLLFICSIIVSVLAVGVAWPFLKAIPYGPWVCLGIGAVTFGAAWFLLGHL